MKGQNMNRTFKATVTLNKTQLAELIIWAVRNNCSGGLTFGAALGDDTARMAVSVAEARGAIAATADLPRKVRSTAMKYKQKVKAARDKRYILTAGGLVDIDASCHALGLTRTGIISNRWESGSACHRVKCAIIKEGADQNPIKWGPRPLVRTTSGTIDIEESLLSLGLSRDTVLRKQWKRGSNPHKVKAAIRCGWREAVKAKRELESSRAHSSRYSTNGNIMGKAEMKAKGLKDLSQVV
jgi:hypothetical protein